MGLLEPLKKLSPNLNVSMAGNELEITIPFRDIVDAVKNSMNEQLRQISTVTVDTTGIRIKIKL
ncbi:MAG: hypothetical protein LZ173_10505 [Thaumarchaeota archaeon]|nr:hypothetical protein [Candidatus Geocrenenecus arthurdayi]